MIAQAKDITLRWYQTEAIEALFEWFQTRDGDPLVTLPTGSGKSLLLSAFLQRARSNYPQLRAVVLATQAELVKQNAKAARLLMPSTDVGIYSAGLAQRDASRPVTVANIQSLAKQAYGIDPFDVIVVDEAHTIADGDAGQYRQFIKAQRQQNPHVRVVGLTATPFKLSSGRLDEGANALFAGIAYEAPITQLIAEGYLCRPITPRAHLQLDTSSVQLRGGEFVAKALAEAVDLEATTEAAVSEMVTRFADRHHWVVFAVSVDHARHIGESLVAHGIPSTVVHGELDRDERAYRLHAFDNGDVRAIVNCQLLTTGWDCQKIDAIALLRPTKSAGLYMQMLGRGMRTHASKSDCLVLDFAGCIEQFGPIDAITVRSKSASAQSGEPVAKLCPACELYVAAGVRLCPNCQHEFPPPPVSLAVTASTAPILSTDAVVRWVACSSVEYSYHEPKPPKVIPTLKATYYDGFRILASEWVCVEHDGFARSKAEQWWAQRSPDACPRTVSAALALADDLRAPVEVGLIPSTNNPRYSQVVGVRFASDAQQNDGLPKACWSCMHFAKQSHCTRWDAPPPADVQAIGCDDWTDELQLPF